MPYSECQNGMSGAHRALYVAGDATGSNQPGFHVQSGDLQRRQPNLALALKQDVAKLDWKGHKMTAPALGQFSSMHPARKMEGCVYVFAG